MQIPKNHIALSLLFLLTTPSYAATNALPYTVVAPTCLLKNIHMEYKTITTTNKLVLIKTNEAGIDALIVAKHNKTSRCGGFIDVTHDWKNYNAQKLVKHSASSFLTSYEMTEKKLLSESYSIQYPDQVSALMKQMNPQYMWNRLEILSSNQDRFSRSDNGVRVAHEIKAEVETMAKENGRNDVTAYFVSTGNYTQPSVVVKIGTSNEEGIVIGAHMDTLSGYIEKKPGADDDGSGTVTVLELARTLLSSGMHFHKPIYLIWYAAEEMGLVGSGYVVADFKKKNIPISAVMQLDMTGYAHKNDPTIWLYDDYTDKNLTAYLETLINTYIKVPVKHDKCGYACSDHASWTKNNFRSALPFEASFSTDNPDIHTSRDTIENLSLAHMKDFANLAIAFTVELAEPI